MTFGEVKYLTKALLTGDYLLPENREEQIMLLKYAFLKIATEADALKLFTASKDEHLIREGQGGMYVRMPSTPDEDSDELDVDDELGYPVARLIASFISNKESRMHEDKASELIRAYNSKVDSYLTSLAEKEYIDQQEMRIP